MKKEFPELISQDIIDRATKLQTAILCDGMLALGIPNSGCMKAEIKPVSPTMKVVGTAITVETWDGDNLPIHIATYASQKEGYVMVIDGKSYPNCAYIGDLIVGAAEAVGFKGIVIDGYSRDLQGNDSSNFPVFSRGFMSAGPMKKNQGNINTPITCGGIIVNPGDLIVADFDGVCVIPKDQILAVLEKAETKLTYEEKRLETIQAYHKARLAGDPLPEIAPDWVLEMLQNPTK